MRDLFSIKTPAYVYSLDQLRSNLLEFKRAAESCWDRGPVVMGLSVKTAPLAAIIKFARVLGYRAEVVSDEEYALAETAGCDADEIIFNGPIKSRRMMWHALDGNSIVNIDSWREVRYAIQYARTFDHAPSVGLRINFDLEARCPGETIAGSLPARFGFSFEDGSLARAVKKLREAGIEPTGIHAHFSTSTHSAEVFGAICETVVEVSRALGLESLSYVDVGGGYYGGGNNTAVYFQYAGLIAEKLSKLRVPGKLALILEPGGSVLATAGSLVGRVIDHKTVRGEHIVVTELSRLNLNSTVFEKKRNTVVAVCREDRPMLQRQTICGYTCMEMDRIGCLEDSPYLDEGDIVIVENAGAYGASFAPGFFIKNPPSLYFLKQRGLDLMVDGDSMRPPFA